MKSPTRYRNRKKSKFLGFYTALTLSLFMIGAACVFAYRQTSQTLEQNLDSLTDQIAGEVTSTSAVEAPVVQIQTDVTKAANVITEAATEAETVSETKADTTQAETEPEEAPVHQYTLPLADASVIQPFSGEELVKSETTGTWQTHNGVDLSCETGDDVFAIDAGKVTEVNNDALWGYTITIDHDNGMTSRYCGLDGSVEVRENDTVQSGQKIGTIGDSSDIESALGTHLHLEVRKNGSYTDPSDYF